MAEISTTYLAKVGREQGGDRFYMKADGEFKFFDVDWEGKSLRNFIGSFFDIAAYGGSATANYVSGPLVMSRYYGMYMFSMPTGFSLCSLHLPSAWKGARLVLDGNSLITDANILIKASTAGGVAGVSMIGMNGLAMSHINLSAGGRAVLFCFTEGVWTICEVNSSATPVLAA
jgi:hypothetical protein